jgi:mono/diheme cytochrome c family protein
MKKLMLAMAALLLSGMSSAASKAAAFEAGEFPNWNTPEAGIFRGNIVFENYCILCHGIKADGTGRAAKMYNPKPANLVLSDKNDQYKELIIRQGGAALGRSEFMPPWGNELTDEQITDVIAYLRSIHLAGASAK